MSNYTFLVAKHGVQGLNVFRLTENHNTGEVSYKCVGVVDYTVVLKYKAVGFEYSDTGQSVPSDKKVVLAMDNQGVTRMIAIEPNEHFNNTVSNHYM